MRLGLKTEKGFLDLYRGTSISIDMQSPLFFGDRDPDIIPGIVAYNFTVPGNAHNRDKLNRPEVLDNYDGFISKEPGEIYYDNDVFMKGTYSIKRASSHSDYEINFIGGLPGNLKDFKTRTLDTVDLGGDRDLGVDESATIAHANDTISNPSDYDYLFGKIRFEEDLTSDIRYINNYWNNTFFRTGNDDGGFARSTLIPFPKLTYILKRIFEDAGLNYDSFFLESKSGEEFDKLIVYNNFSLDRIETISDPVEYTDLRLSNIINLKNHVPNLKINQFIKDAIMPFGGVTIIDSKENKVTITNYNNILDRSDLSDWTSKIYKEYHIEERYKDIPTGLSYSHISTDSISEEYDIDLTGRNVLSEVEKTTDLTNTDELYDIRLVNSLNQYFYNADSSSVVWRFFSKKLNPYKIGENLIQLTSDTVFMEKVFTSLLGTFDRFTPVFISKYISPINPGIEKINKTILMFYRGLDQESNGQNYPFISNNVYNRSQVKIGAFSLLCDGDYGLYNLWWKRWLELIQIAKPVSFIANLSSSDLRNFDFTKKVKIGDHKYFIKRIRTTLTTEEIKTASIEAIKIT